jgi:hypothetical protein
VNIGEMVAALLMRDLFRGRQERQRARDQASLQFKRALNSIEDIVIDELSRANEAVIARVDALDARLAVLGDAAIGGKATMDQSFSSAQEPLRVWARSAKPRLERAMTDLTSVRSLAPEARQPAEAYALASEIMNAVEVYVSAADAFLAGDFDGGTEVVKQAHIAWRQMQGRLGLAKYF